MLIPSYAQVWMLLRRCKKHWSKVGESSPDLSEFPWVMNEKSPFLPITIIYIDFESMTDSMIIEITEGSLFGSSFALNFSLSPCRTIIYAYLV